LLKSEYKQAISNFIKSLAGYSLVCYFLAIKDRHNGNILIDDQGHIIHIDFGFMLSNAPGKGIQFEKAPFKLTKEFVDVIGGVKTESFSRFRKLLWK
jgi:phosphatidylinositol 4-kinase